MPSPEPPAEQRKLLDIAGAAEYLGLKVKTVYRYRTAKIFAVPDYSFGHSDGWYCETLDAWQAGRPGRTGRPKKPQ